MYTLCRKDDNVKKIRELLTEGADPDFQVKKGREQQPSAIFVAICDGCKDVVELLLEFGANPNVANGYDESPLDVATEKGNKGLIALLTPLCKQSPKVQKQLGEKICDMLWRLGNKGSASYKFCSPEDVDALVQQGANLNVAVNYKTAMILAAEYNLTQMVPVLLRGKPDLSLKDHAVRGGKTALQVAESSGFLEIVRMIKESA